MSDGVNPRFDFAEPLPAIASVVAAHFIAIGGSGMSGVARLFMDAGVRVSGSDAADSETLRSLHSEGAEIFIGQRADNLLDLSNDAVVVISSAIREDNAELAQARARGLRVLHRAQALAMVARDKRLCAVAGANGKTTTSGMATVALRSAGIDTSFAIGAPIAGLGANSAVGQADSFVVEADESDGSFVVYRPNIAIVTNVKDDHLDFYGTSARLHAAYDEFVATIQPGGLLIACADDAGSAALAARAQRDGLRTLTYGRTPDADLVLSQERGAQFDWHADLQFPDGSHHELHLRVPGAHNLLNAAGVALALHAGYAIGPADAVAGLGEFRGTARRFEPRGVAEQVRVVDDYAHNPGKLDAVVRTGLALRDGGRLIVVFQPHLYSRTRDGAAEMAAALRMADEAIVMEIFGAREAAMPGVTASLITDEVPGAVQVADHDAALTAVVERARPGDLVLTVGAGDVTRLGPRILQALAHQRR